VRKIGQFSINLWRLPLVALACLWALSHPMAFGAEPKIIVEIEKSGDAFIVNALIDVQVPVEVAWDVFVDIDHMADFLEDLTFSKVLSRTGNTWIVRQDGIARYGLLSFAFASEREIYLDPMKRIVTRNLSGTLQRMHSEAAFVPIDQGVRIKYYAEIVPDSLLARIFGLSVVRREVGEQFASMSKEMRRRYAITASAAIDSAKSDGPLLDNSKRTQ
jgi:hypothetical protein